MIYLYGASGHAKVIIDILEKNGMIISGLIDGNPEIKKLMEYAVKPEVEIISSDCGVLVSIGNNTSRKRVAESLNSKFINAIHPNAVLAGRVSLGSGVAIMAGAVVNSEVTVGNHVILNTNCTVDHDCSISDFVHISPNAALAGNVEVGEGSHVGIGACVIQGIKIGCWATIGAGAVVIRNVPDYAVVVGNPGKIIKYNHPK
ncbi:MAG: acetyltransferase [Mucilaginibacter sp.]